MLKRVVVGLGVFGAVASVPAHAAAESWISAAVTYLSGDGFLTQIAVIAAVAVWLATGWVAAKLGFAWHVNRNGPSNY